MLATVLFVEPAPLVGWRERAGLNRGWLAKCRTDSGTTIAAISGYSYPPTVGKRYILRLYGGECGWSF